MVYTPNDYKYSNAKYKMRGAVRMVGRSHIFPRLNGSIAELRFANSSLALFNHIFSLHHLSTLNALSIIT